MSVLARGVYRYRRDGALQAVTEPWNLQRTAQGLLLRGQRLLDGRMVLDVEADYIGPSCTAIRLWWHTGDQKIGAYYTHRSDTLEWGFDSDAAIQSMPLPARSRLFPLLRAATGPLLLKLAAGPLEVLVPNIRGPSDKDFLHPLRSERWATAQALHYRYFGGEYGEAGCDCWLNALGLLQRYRWATPQGEWEVRLEELYTAGDFAGFF